MGGALKLMAEKSCVDCHVKWGLVERLPELFIDRCLEDDEKLLRVISTWKPQTPNRLIFAQRPEKYDLFRRPERYLLDPYDKLSTENVMQTPWNGTSRQSLVQVSPTYFISEATLGRFHRFCGTCKILISTE